MNPATYDPNDSIDPRRNAGEGIQLPDCPKCGTAIVVQLLKSMRRYDRAHDWFRCDRCGQLYTRTRTGN
jgi:hypothetical protein